MGSLQNKGFGKLKYLDSFITVLIVLRVIRTVTNYEILLSLLYEQFYKIEFFIFRSPQIFEIAPAILKEREGFNLQMVIYFRI